MKNKILYFILLLNLFLISLNANSISIDNNTKYIDILSKSQIYIDETRTLDINTIQTKDFRSNNQSALGFGYDPDVDVWVKFTLSNPSNKIVRNILEYDNTLTTSIEFFEKNNGTFTSIKEGSYYLDEKRSTKNPVFFIELQPDESKIYYIKATSYVTTLIVKLKLWDHKEFYDKEIKHQFILALFFGAMIVLGLYNLFIYFITRDISYLFYVIYIIGITFHHVLYVGIGNLYLFSEELRANITQFAAIFVALPIYALAFFTKTFLNTKQYKYWDMGLNLFLVFVPIFTIAVIATDFFTKYRTLVPLLLFTYLVLITIYASYKRNIQAYYILFGWSIMLLAAVFMFLSSVGVFDIYQFSPYIVEFAIVVEALIFSIALAAKIRILEIEKNNANKKLIEQQKNEQIHLEEQVNKKTKELKELNENLEQKVNEEVNHVKQMERKLFEAEKMAAMGEMMGNIAHQWRQPLSVISTQTSGLIIRKEYGKLDDEALDHSLNQVMDMTKHLSQTIDDFRDYIRGDMEKTEFFVEDAIHKSVSITNASIKSSYIEMIYDFEEDLEISNYENALIQSIVNILNNAKDALKQNNPDIKQRIIYLKTRKIDDKIQISIKDSAGGIPEDIIKKVFEPYFTTKEKDHGTGLGLHMTNNMITSSMGGEIEVQNVEFKYDDLTLRGAEFIITLDCN